MQCACANLSSVACPALSYFSISYHKWHDFRKNVTEHNTRVLRCSTTFVWNNSLSEKKPARHYHKFLMITNSMHFSFIYLISLHVSSINCSSSGDRIVLIHHLVWSVCVSDCLVCRSRGNCSSLVTGIPSSHSHRLVTPDDVLIQFDLLMISTRCSKHVERWNK